jgi:hypothetical protein
VYLPIQDRTVYSTTVMQHLLLAVKWEESLCTSNLVKLHIKLLASLHCKKQQCPDASPFKSTCNILLWFVVTVSFIFVLSLPFVQGIMEEKKKYKLFSLHKNKKV